MNNEPNSKLRIYIGKSIYGEKMFILKSQPTSDIRLAMGRLRLSSERLDSEKNNRFDYPNK